MNSSESTPVSTPKSSPDNFDRKLAKLRKAIASKEGVTKTSLTNVYGPHALAVLQRSRLVKAWSPPVVESARAAAKSKALASGETEESANRIASNAAFDEFVDWNLGRDEKRTPKRYVAEPASLPTLDHFQWLLRQMYEVSVSSLIENAYSAIEELKDECQEIVDNAAGTNFETTSRIEGLQEAADELDQVDAVEAAECLDEVKVVRLPSQSHRTGRGHRLGEALGDLELACVAVEKFLAEHPEHREDIGPIVAEMRGHIDNVESVEFPGMYG